MMNLVLTMRSTAIVLVLLSHSLVHYALCSGAILRVLKHHRDIIHPHHIMRRQLQALPSDEMPTTAPSAEDIAYCESISNDAYCSSGVAQSFVDHNLRCGEKIKNIRPQFSECVRSENGAFCGSLIFTSVMEQNLEANCSGEFASNSKCSPNCRTHLEDFKSKFGCCINAYLNYSYAASRKFYNVCGTCVESRCRL